VADWADADCDWAEDDWGAGEWGADASGENAPGAPPAARGEASLCEGEAVVAAVTGAGGPSCDISAANAPLKPSALAPDCGVAASPGTAGLAVETWADAASMAPGKRLSGDGACCA